MTLVGSTSIWFGCLMRCTNGRIRLKLRQMSRVGRRWWSFFGCFYSQSSFAEHEQWVRLVWGHRGGRSFRLTMTSKMLFGRWCWYCDLLIVKSAIDMRLTRIEDGIKSIV